MRKLLAGSDLNRGGCRIMSVRTCSNWFFESLDGHGKSPCLLRSRLSRSANVDWLGAVTAWSNMAFGRM
jgi:hypothetical protein